MNNTKPALRFVGFTDAWEQRKLGEVMDITSVKRIHQSDWTNNGIRFLRARDIVSAAKGEEPSEYLYIAEEKYEEYSKVSGKVQIGDLLVTGVGTIGVPMLVVHTYPLYFKDGNVIWFKNKNNMDGNFLYYSFIGMKIQKYIRDVAGIGTVGTYTIDSGKKTPISLPSIEEQAKIGSLFQALDTLITLHQRKLDLLKKQKQSLIQKVFLKSGEKIPELRFEGYKNDWEQRKLGDEFKKISERNDGSFGRDHWISVAKMYFQSPEKVQSNNIDTRTYVMREGDIAFEGHPNSEFKFGRFVANDIGAGVVSELFPIYKHQHEYDNNYWKNAIQIERIMAPIFAKSITSSGNSSNKLDTKHFLRQKILIPQINEQKKIGSLFQELDNLITLQEKYVATLKKQKQSLLQKMFV